MGEIQLSQFCDEGHGGMPIFCGGEFVAAATEKGLGIQGHILGAGGKSTNPWPSKQLFGTAPLDLPIPNSAKHSANSKVLLKSSGNSPNCAPCMVSTCTTTADSTSPTDTGTVNVATRPPPPP